MISSFKDLNRFLQRGFTPPKRSLDSLQSIWERPLGQLATHKDLARLCNTMVIQTESGSVLHQVHGSGLVLAEDILSSLVKLNEPEYLPTLQKCFQENINPNGDVSTEMKRLFCDKFKDVNFCATKTAALLRGVNQEIVYPVIRELRDTFYEKFPFKDIRGTWKVGITRTTEGNIIVSHYKQEQSYSTEDGFTFHWQLNLKFNDDFTGFTPEYYISYVNFQGATNHTLLKAMNPYFHRATQYRNIWMKEDKSTVRSIANSLPRIAEGSIIQIDEQTVFKQENAQNDQLTLVRDFLLALAFAVDPPHIRESIHKKIEAIMAEDHSDDADSDTTERLKKALKYEDMIPFKSKTFQILKAINYDMPKPAIMQLREHVYPYAQYRDIKRSWQTNISLSDTKYKITVSKKECSASLGEEEYFDFGWELAITFNTQMNKLIDAEFYIIEYSLHEKMKPEQSSWMKKLFEPFLSTKFNVNIKCTIHAPEILAAVIKTMKANPHLGRHTIQLQDSNDSFQLLPLLESLHEADSRGEAFPLTFVTKPRS